MKIQITADDIANGLPSRCNFCPVALALSRAMGCYVSVVTHSWRVRNTYQQRLLPKDAVDFISDFDAGRPVAPFEFDVDG